MKDKQRQVKLDGACSKHHRGCTFWEGAVVPATWPSPSVSEPACLALIVTTSPVLLLQVVQLPLGGPSTSCGPLLAAMPMQHSLSQMPPAPARMPQGPVNSPACPRAPSTAQRAPGPCQQQWAHLGGCICPLPSCSHHWTARWCRPMQLVCAEAWRKWSLNATRTSTRVMPTGGHWTGAVCTGYRVVGC